MTDDTTTGQLAHYDQAATADRTINAEIGDMLESSWVYADGRTVERFTVTPQIREMFREMERTMAEAGELGVPTVCRHLDLSTAPTVRWIASIPWALRCAICAARNAEYIGMDTTLLLPRCDACHAVGVEVARLVARIPPAPPDGDGYRVGMVIDASLCATCAGAS